MFDLLTYQKSDPKFSNNLWKMIDLFYPPFCCNCGVIGFEICPECFSQITYINKNKTCKICGSYLTKKNQCIFEDHKEFYFDKAISWAEYKGPLKQILKKIKYKRGIGLVKFLTPGIVELLNNWQISYDFIVPVPLGNKRKSDRGYNQSEIIANPIAARLNIPLRTNVLTRNRETVSQVGLDFEQRKSNVEDAFTADHSQCKEKSVLLIDDITTTFSTINECAKALKDAGAKRVFCFTVARTTNK